MSVLPSDLAYRGWIPTVSGRLSFSRFGDADYPTQAESANFEVSGIRYVICYQKRHTDDLPIRSLRKLLRISGDMWFVCVAQTAAVDGVQQEALRGTLGLVPRKQVWRREWKQYIASNQRILRQRGVLGNISDSDPLPNSFPLMEKRIAEDCFLSASFLLKRSGAVELAAIQLNCREDYPTFATDESNAGPRTDNLVAQLYYFLRDIGHRHQHHDSSTDTVIGLTRCRMTADGIDDDISWRTSTLHNLHRKIISHRRAQTIQGLDRARGLLAYATTFYNICQNDISHSTASDSPTVHSKTPLTRYFERNILESIAAARMSIEHKAAHRRMVVDSVRNWTIGAIIIVAMLSGLANLAGYQAATDMHPIYSCLLDTVSRYPLWALGSIVVFVLLCHKISQIHNLREGGSGRVFLRLAHGLFRRAGVFFYFAFSILFLVIAYLLNKWLEHTF